VSAAVSAGQKSRQKEEEEDGDGFVKFEGRTATPAAITMFVLRDSISPSPSGTIFRFARTPHHHTHTLPARCRSTASSILRHHSPCWRRHGGSCHTILLFCRLLCHLYPYAHSPSCWARLPNKQQWLSLLLLAGRQGYLHWTAMPSYELLLPRKDHDRLWQLLGSL